MTEWISHPVRQPEHYLKKQHLIAVFIVWQLLFFAKSNAINFGVKIVKTVI
jgi:hypothetical protein